MNATQGFSNPFPPLLTALPAYAPLLLGATLLSQITPGLFIGLILAKWACPLQNSALTSYWVGPPTPRLVRLGLLLGGLFPIIPMLILSKLSVLWAFGLSLGGPALLELAEAGPCYRVQALRFSTSLS